jgi:hypothetical protein
VSLDATALLHRHGYWASGSAGRSSRGALGRGPSAFAFLVGDWGFLGPERIDDGLAYHRPGLHVRIEFWTWNHETGFSTTVERVSSLGARVEAASLGRLYVACGLGPAQDVPETAGSGHALRKR